MRASKDNFWSGSRRTDRGQETSPFLSAVVTALSGGPVGFADELMHTDPTVLWPTTTESGTLLHLSRPATTVDRCFYAPSDMGPGEIRAGHAAVNGTADAWYTAVAIELQQGNNLVPVYAPRAVQFHPNGGRFSFVWLPARTMHPHGAYVWRAKRNQGKYPPETNCRSFSQTGSRPPTCGPHPRRWLRTASGSGTTAPAAWTRARRVPAWPRCGARQLPFPRLPRLPARLRRGRRRTKSSGPCGRPHPCCPTGTVHQAAAPAPTPTAPAGRKAGSSRRQTGAAFLAIAVSTATANCEPVPVSNPRRLAAGDAAIRCHDHLIV